jgi:hypothetical protein
MGGEVNGKGRTMTLEEYLWSFMPRGYLFTIAIETPILLVGLSSRHSWGVRLFCGFWLTACTYPIVVLVLPMFFEQVLHMSIEEDQYRWLYLLVAETFAPVAECALFWMAFGKRELVNTRSFYRDMITITVANLASFGFGELLVRLPDDWDFLFGPVKNWLK